MQPDLILIPFGKNAAAGTIDPIPETRGPDDDPQQATWNEGFPLVTMTPLGAGGIPPKGQDFNGVLKAISEHTVFVGGGGQYKWSDEYVVEAGGYSIGDVIQADDGLNSYVSLTNSNTANFNTTPGSIGVSWGLYAGRASQNQATETVAGIAKIATSSQVSAGTDDASIVTPLKLKAATAGTLLSVQRFTSNGTYTPSAGVSFVIFEVQGGGGGGGGAVATGGGYALGGGGGSGSYAKVKLTAADIGASKAITIGAAGVGGIGVNGGNGGATTVGSLITAPGGNGGWTNIQVVLNQPDIAFGGSPGGISTNTAGTAIVLSTGIAGLIGANYSNGGGGGGAGSPIANGTGGADSSLSSDLVGKSARHPGGGGGGAINGPSASPKTGGPGLPGMVIAWEFK